ncbi:DUF421 domain-containing protein [Microbacterium sp. KSW2-21]|uniref:DUF421 domain-containing protein n=1 Tax=Microbacterium algihabitans TaxID=3075992 RepID=A0ABU3S079_9MICO|nr:YetF domain-containing protein [Microbacterium sp. KSW2-21]MDU0328543.1 DUF421 domain-containing protein [Microbacterium sp. KSW2-21]
MRADQRNVEVQSMWFDSWFDLIRIVLVGTASYASLVAILRISGKRTLAQLNAFDLIVTVALGSTFATILLSSDVSWTEGIVAMLLLVGLQLAVAWASTRWHAARALVAAAPLAVLRSGEFCSAAMRRHRLTEAEIMQAVRAAGHGDLSSIAIVILETNGTISVIPKTARGDGTALRDVT